MNKLASKENQTMEDDNTTDGQPETRTSDEEQPPRLSPVTIIISDSANETDKEATTSKAKTKTERSVSTEETIKGVRTSLSKVHEDIIDELGCSPPCNDIYNPHSDGCDPCSDNYDPASPVYVSTEQKTYQSKKNVSTSSTKRKFEDQWAVELKDLHKGSTWIDIPINKSTLDVMDTQLALQVENVIAEQEHCGLYLKFCELSKVSAFCTMQHLSTQRITDLNVSTVFYAKNNGITEAELSLMDNIDLCLLPANLSQSPNIFVIAKFKYNANHHGQKLPKKRLIKK